MDINPSYEDLQKIYKKYFSIGFLGEDISNKLALVSLVCYLTNLLKTKNPDITHWTVLYKLNNGAIPEDILKGISIVCSDFAYGCKNFLTFDLKDKEIPAKITELLNMSLPF